MSLNTNNENEECNSITGVFLVWPDCKKNQVLILLTLAQKNPLWTAIKHTQFEEKQEKERDGDFWYEARGDEKGTHSNSFIFFLSFLLSSHFSLFSFLVSWENWENSCVCVCGETHGVTWASKWISKGCTHVWDMRVYVRMGSQSSLTNANK